jgi:DNA-binding NarL/FixJ family response regulator
MTQPSTPNARATRIMVVDDHPIVREGYKRLIESHDGLQVCAEAEEMPQAIRLIRETSPHVVIIDISLKGGSGLELIKEIKALFPTVKMLVASMHDENLFAERALRAGAMGYVSKQEATTQLTKAIFHVMHDKVFLSEAMTDRMLSRSVGAESSVPRSPIETLSDRELEVFELIGQGQTTRNIAEKLQLSPKTVETYRENIKDKLSLENATELTRHAVQWVLENS